MESKKSDIGSAFDKLMAGAFTAVDGVLVERDGTGYMYHGQHFENEETLKAYLWRFREQFNSSINRVKK